MQLAKLPLSPSKMNGNSFKPTARTTINADGTSTSMIPGAVTTEEKTRKKNDIKAKIMLLMVLANEHLLTFNQYKDAKTLLQKIISHFAILGENISQEDLNLKFLTSLPSEWNTHVVVWRNKPDLNTMSFDDLYNNFKIVKQEVKRTATSSTSSSSQNMAFVSSPSSINKVNTANVQVSTANSSVSTDSTLDSTANLSDATVYAFLARNARSILDSEKSEPRNHDNGNRNQDCLRRTVNVEETSSKAMVAIDGAGFDWCFMAEEEVTINMALALRDASFKDSEIIALKSEIEKLKKEKEYTSIKVKKTPDTSLVEELVSEKEKQTIFPTKIEFVKQQDKTARKPVKYAEMYRSQKPRGNQRNWNNLKSQQLGTNSNDFARFKVSIGKGSTSKETDTSQDYIVMPLWKDSSLIDSPSMNVSHDEPELSCDAKKKDDEGGVTAALDGLHQAPEAVEPWPNDSIGELTFFLGLQVKKKEDRIFISQDKYVTDILKKFSFQDVNDWIFDVSYHLPPYIMFYPRDPPFDLVAYSDSDYAGASLDRKSTTGGCQFLGCRLISW
ncbi:hypothetical protein Tco_0658590 [Tanacetum coccineum]